MSETNAVLTKKNERYIENEIALIRKQLLEGNTTIMEGNTFLSVNANSDGPLSPEDVECIIQVLSHGIRQVKIKSILQRSIESRKRVQQRVRWPFFLAGQKVKYLNI